jgi:hypothetical protein
MPTFRKKDTIGITITVLLFLAVVHILNYFYDIMPEAELLTASTWYIATGLGAYLGIVGAMRIGLQNFVGKGLLFLGISSGLNLLGYISWDYISLLQGIDVPYPSVADAAWMLAVPAAIIGISFLLRIYHPQIKARFIIEAVAMAAVMSAVIIYFIGWPDLTESTFTAGFFDIFYTLTDVFWLSLAFITLRIAGGRIFKGLLVYTVAIVILAIGDILYAIRSANETYFYGDISDTTLLIGWLLVTASIYLTAQTFSNNETTSHV